MPDRTREPGWFVDAYPKLSWAMAFASLIILILALNYAWQ